MQLCQILEDMHEKKLIHRDIKPGNVMIEPGNKVRLIDFGISKIASKTATFTKSEAGTRPYQAPEIFDPNIDMNPEDKDARPISISAKVDVWAVGCLISEIFSGVIPWHNKVKNEMAIVRKLIAKAEFPIPNNIDEDVKEVIKEACAVDPADRLSSLQLKEKIQKLMEATDEK